MKIAILGCGNMGKTYANSFLKYEILKKHDLYLIDAFEPTRLQLKNEGFPNVLASVKDLNDPIDILILAVKPQDFWAESSHLTSALSEHTVIVSIMAGIRLDKLIESVGHHAIIRAMPNTPAQIGMGMTAFVASNETTVGQVRQVEKLFNATGRTLFLDEESQIDSVTALSGSGPAYVFYFIQALIEAGTAMGLSESDAKTMVRQTVLGSFHLMNQSSEPLLKMIQNVASKGGTTEAALTIFETYNLKLIVKEALLAAEKRSKELSENEIK